jgi:hypothetical protein
MASHYNFGIFKLFYLNMELKFQWSNNCMYNVQDSSDLYDNALRLLICEDWHFTHMWTSLARLHHFTKRGGLGQINKLNPANFYWSARQEREWSCICVLRDTCFTFFLRILFHLIICSFETLSNVVIPNLNEWDFLLYPS